MPPGKADFVVVNDNGRPFAFRLLFKGDTYGNGAVWGESLTSLPSSVQDAHLGVEIYDATYARDSRFKPEGQVICQYYLATVLNLAPSSRPYQYGGLNLHGGEDAWRLDAEDVVRMEDEIRNLFVLAIDGDSYLNEKHAGAMLAFLNEFNGFDRLRLTLPNESRVTVSEPCFTDDAGNRLYEGVAESFTDGKYDVWFEKAQKYARYGRDEAALAETGALKKWDEATMFEPVFSPANREIGDLPYRKADFLRIAQGNEEWARSLFYMCADEASILPHPETVWEEIGGAEFFRDVGSDRQAELPSEEELRERYGQFGEHPRYPVEDWKYEIQNDDTRRGYWEWVAASIERDADDEDDAEAPGAAASLKG